MIATNRLFAELSKLNLCLLHGLPPFFYQKGPPVRISLLTYQLIDLTFSQLASLNYLFNPGHIGHCLFVLSSDK